MRILFVNHTSASSGAEVALMSLVRALDGSHACAVASPAGGNLADAVRAAGVRHFSIPSVELSLKPHPVRTPHGLARMGAAGLAVRAAARRHRADIVHANSVRAGLVCGIAARAGAPPVVVQVHDHLPSSRLGRVIRAAVASTAAGVVAVTDYTAATFDAGLSAPRAERVYVSIDRRRFDPERVTAALLREELELPAGATLIGHVAQITPWKAQDTSIEMLARLRATHPDTHLALAGSIPFASGTRYDNHGYLASLHALAGALGQADHVHFLGQRSDVPALMRAFALTVLPSWTEPFGLSAAESMAMGTPALVTAEGGLREYVRDGVSGRVLPPRRPALWADAVRELLDDPARLRAMGAAARAATATLTPEQYAEDMLAVYERARERVVGKRSLVARTLEAA